MMEISVQDAPYRRALRGINLEQALNYIAKCSISIWWQTPPQPLYRHSDVVRGIARISQPYALVTLAYLASEIIANARGDQEFGLEEFNSGVEFIDLPSGVVQEFSQTDRSFRGIQILLTTAYPQIAIADGPRIINRFGRYCLLYKEIGTQNGTGSMPGFIARFPDFKEGLQIEQFMIAGMVVFALALMGRGRIDTDSLTDLRVGPTLVTKDLIDHFLVAVSADPDVFKDRMLRTISEKWHAHTLTNPLLHHPVIAIGKTYLAPVPQLLLDRCGEGIRGDFKEGLSDRQFQKFSKDLGSAFEKYIQHLIERTDSTWQVWNDLLYDGVRTCDLLILDDHDLLLVECKTSPLRKLVKTWMSKSEYDQALNEVARGVEAIVRTAKHLKEGKLEIAGLDIDQVQRWAGIAVTIDEYLLRPSAAHVFSSNEAQSMTLDTSPVRGYFLQICRRRIKRSKHISWRDVEEFPENHIQVLSADDFEQRLAATIPGHNHLFDVVIGQALQAVHPVLEEQFERYWGSVSPAQG